MSPKNDTPILLATFVLTTGLIGGGLWLLSQNSGLNLGQLLPGKAPANREGTTGTNPATIQAVKNVPSGIFSYGGSTSWAPIRAKIDPAIHAAFPSFRLRYTDPLGGTAGSSAGIRMLLNGQIAFAQSSRPLEPQEYKQAEQRGFQLKQVTIAIEGIAIAVHPTLPLPGLTLEQLRQIYTGRLTNWREVGGPNLPITPYSRRVQDAGTVEFFITTILQGQPLGRNVQSVASTTEALRKVANTPGSIYYASAPEVVPQCTVKPLAIARQGATLVPPYQLPLVPPEACPQQRNQLHTEAFATGSYPLTRQLFVVIQQNGQVEQQAGEAYTQFLLSQEGQQLIAASDFVKLR